MPTISPQFGKATPAVATPPAIAKPMIGVSASAAVNPPMIVATRVNFAIVALQDVLTALRASKADTIKRLQAVDAARMGAEMMAAHNAAAGAPSGMWTPFGQVVLPIIHSSNPTDRNAELAIALAMCNAADKELRAELTKTQRLIDQVVNAIAELTAP